MGLYESVLDLASVGSAGYRITLAVVVIAIMLSGLAIGLGIALRSRRLREFGMEELLQSFINAALLGGFVLIVGLLAGLSSGMVSGNAAVAACYNSTGVSYLLQGGQPYDQSQPFAAGEGQLSSSGQPGNGNLTLASYSECLVRGMEMESFTFSSELYKASLILSFASDIQLNTGIVDYKPFSGLSSLADSLSSVIKRITFYQSALTANALLLRFSYLTSLTVFLPLGLIFRSFFATRKIGGLLISMAIGLFIIYPMLNVIMLTDYFPEFTSSYSAIANFTASYSEPVMFRDLSVPDSVSYFANETSRSQYRKDLVESTYNFTSVAADVEGALFFFSIVLPAISLFITLVSIVYMARVLGAEFISSPIEIL